MKQAGILALIALLVSCSSSKGENPLEKKSDYHFKLGTNCYLNQDVPGALAELYKAIELNPGNANAHHMLGFIYMGRRQHSEALKHISYAVELDPKFHEARANMGALLLAMEDWQGAIDYLMPLTHEPLYPTPYLVNNNIGWAYYKLKKYPLAEKYLKMAILLNPKMCLAYNNIAMVQEVRRQTEAAIEAYSEATKLCPDYQEPLFHLGVLYQNLSRPADALKTLQKCVKLDPDGQYGRRCKQRLP
ncbi:MAG: tetratricopeptide repeat protein [Pseudomonadota bacterium]